MYEADEEYLWSHSPAISAGIRQRVAHYLTIHDDRVDESAVFELENDKFLYIRFSGNVKNLEEGVTDIEEYDSVDKAVKEFTLYL